MWANSSDVNVEVEPPRREAAVHAVGIRRGLSGQVCVWRRCGGGRGR